MPKKNTKNNTTKRLYGSIEKKVRKIDQNPPTSGILIGTVVSANHKIVKTRNEKADIYQELASQKKPIYKA